MPETMLYPVWWSYFQHTFLGLSISHILCKYYLIISLFFLSLFFPHCFRIFFLNFHLVTGSKKVCCSYNTLKSSLCCEKSRILETNLKFSTKVELAQALHAVLPIICGTLNVDLMVYLIFSVLYLCIQMPIGVQIMKVFLQHLHLPVSK